MMSGSCLRTREGYAGMYCRVRHRQGPASTRYSTQTQNFLSYSNSTWAKHYSDRVVSSINSRNFRIISTIIQKQPVMEKIFISYSTLSLSFRSNDKTQFQDQTLTFFSIQSNLDIMTVISLMMMTSKIMLSTTAIATLLFTMYYLTRT